MQNSLCNVCRPIKILVAKVCQRNLDYAKNLRVKYFTSGNIPIYDNSTDVYCHFVCLQRMCTYMDVEITVLYYV